MICHGALDSCNVFRKETAPEYADMLMFDDNRTQHCRLAAGLGAIAVYCPGDAAPRKFQAREKSRGERTRGIRLFHYNKALRWPQKVLTQCEFCPVL